MSTRKRRGGVLNTRRSSKRSRVRRLASRTVMATESIELDESAGEEVVDLTCETSDTVVVDLTNNDSVVIVDESRTSGDQQTTDSCVVSSGDEEDEDVYVKYSASRPTASLEHHSSSGPTSGTVSCPICMDGYTEIVQSRRIVVSTKCGHIFCSQCLRDSLKNANTCPTCRKRLNHKQYHPIYI